VTQVPLLFGREVVKDLVNRNMAEMQIGGKPARTVFVRMVPVFFIKGKLFFKESFHSLGGSAGASTLIHRPDPMVHRKFGQGLRIPTKNFRGSGRPTLQDPSERRDRGFVLQPFEGFGVRHL